MRSVTIWSWFRRNCGLSAALALSASTALSSPVDAIAKVIEREYFDARAAAVIAAEIREAAARGDYALANDPQKFAARLTEDLVAISGDKHLAVGVAGSEFDSPPEQLSRAAEVRKSNGGVRKVEILEGNVGYFQLNAFFRREEATAPITHAFGLLARTDALILDLRQNGGGSPDSLELVLGHLLGPKIPLLEIISRSGKRATYNTSGDPGITRYQGPVYVLVSSKTFSAGEGLAFLLREHGRAEIIGERTAGAANPGRPYRADQTFNVTVPNGQLRSLKTGTNWEGTGVTPDAETNAEEALGAAIQRAKKKLSIKLTT